MGTAPRIRFQAPQLPPVSEVHRYFVASESARWYANGGPCQQLLESRLQAYLGSATTPVLVGNATVGLMLALRLATTRTRSRRYVVVPSYTFVATASAVDWAGFEPLFVDVDPVGWHLSVDALADAMERHAPHIAAVMPCTTFGTPPSEATSAGWRRLGEDYDVPVVVDSAAAFGGLTESGGTLGQQGQIDVFSFHATKPFAIGEGGMVLARAPEDAAALRQLANFGLNPARVADDTLGFNAKLSEWACATGLAVLDTFDRTLANRRARAAQMREGLETAGFGTQAAAAGAATQFVPVLTPDPSLREKVVEHAASRGVELRTYYDQPLHTMPALQSAPRADALPVTRDLAARTLSLPMANDLDHAATERIVTACLEAL